MYSPLDGRLAFALLFSPAVILLGRLEVRGQEVVAPAAYAAVEANSESGPLSGGIRIQTLYGAAHFPAFPIWIREIRYRPNVATGPFTTPLADVRFSLSTSPKNPDGLSTTLAQNVGADEVIVFRGAITLSSAAAGPAVGPRAFDIVIPLTTPFRYDPTLGSLLLEVRNYGTDGTPWVDASDDPSDGASRVFGNGADAAEGTSVSTVAEVVQFAYEDPALRLEPVDPWISGSVPVRLITTVAGGQIRYTLDGSAPGPGSALYTEPFPVSTSTRVKAQVFVGGHPVSSEISALYLTREWDDGIPIVWRARFFGAAWFQTAAAGPLADPDADGGLNIQEWLNNADPGVADPPEFSWSPLLVFNPDGGTFSYSTPAGLGTPVPGATLRFTTDGSEPDDRSAAYTEPLRLTTTTTLSCRGFVHGNPVTPVRTHVFTRTAEPGTTAWVVPAGTEFVEGNESSGPLTGGLRIQTLYGAPNFPAHPIEISSLRYRPDQAVGGLTNSLSEVEFRLSTSTRDPDALSSTFAANVGPDETVVFHGPLALTSAAAGPAGGPLAFDLIIPLSTPFVYDPAAGHLLLEVRNHGPESATWVDALTVTTDQASRIYAGRVDAATAENVGTAAEILQFVYSDPTLTIRPFQRWFSPSTTVQLATTVSGGVMHYTLDGTTPTPGSPAYSDPFVVTESTRVRARVFLGSEPASDVVTALYLDRSWDDGLPSDWRTQFFGPDWFQHADARALADPDLDGGANLQEWLAQRSPVAADPAATAWPALITLAPEVSTFNFSLIVSLTTAVPSGVLRYTTDGSDPDADAPVYAAPIRLEATATVKGAVFHGVNRVSPILGRTFTRTGDLNTFDLVAPEGLANLEGNSYSGPLNGAIRIQTLYGPEHFPSRPIEITEIRYRPQAGAIPFSVTLADLQVTLSTSPRSPDNLSADFEANFGPDRLVVFRGPLTFTSAASGPPDGPKDFDLVIPLAAPFEYDPSRGALLVELQNRSGEIGPVVDSVSSDSDHASRIFAAGVNPAWGASTSTDAEIVQFVASDSPISALPRERWFGDSVQVTLASRATTGALHYTLDGSEPTAASPTYTAPLLITTSTRIQARVFAEGQPVTSVFSTLYLTRTWDDGLPAEWRAAHFGEAWFHNPQAEPLADPDADGGLNVQEWLAATDPVAPNPAATSWPALVTCSHDGGEFSLPLLVQLATPIPNSTLRYTLNGSDPSATATAYTEPLWIHVSTTLKCRVFVQGNPVSPVLQRSFSRTGGSDPMDLVLPAGSESVEGGSESGPMNGDIRIQTLYGAENFPPLPLVIHELRYRPNARTPAFAVHLADVEIHFATCPRLPDALSSVFADNLGADDTVVFDGPLTLSSDAGGPASGPMDFDIRIPLTTPFYFDPTQGGLLLDIRKPSAEPTPWVDAITASSDHASRVFSPGAGSTSGLYPSTAAEVIQLGVTVVSPDLYALPPAGAYTQSLDVRLITHIDGGQIRYTLDGTDPTPTSAAFTAPIRLTDTRTLNARVFVGGAPASDLLTLNYTITLTPPQITAPPLDQTVLAGDQASFAVGVIGSEPLIYQWFRNGVEIPGATGPTLHLANATTDQAGAYFVRVRNDVGTVTSTPAVLVVNPRPVPPTITQHPVGQMIPFGGTATLTATVTGTPPLSFAWLRNGAPVPGATESTLVLSGIAWHQAGAYQLLVQNVAGGTYSQIVNVLVVHDTQPPVILLASPAGETSPDERIVFSGTLTDNAAVASARWEFNGQAMGNLALTGPAFAVPFDALVPGENVFRVVATDPSGNESMAEAGRTWIPVRALRLGSGTDTREGLRTSLPLTLASSGGIGGISARLRYDPEMLTDPTVTWEPSLTTAIHEANTALAGEVRLTLSLPGTAFTAGTQPLALVSFRARSVPARQVTSVEIDELDVAGPDGAWLPFGTETTPGTVAVLPRRLTGDNNGNDLLDVGDASLIQRLIVRLDPPRTWDVTGNDLNGSGSLEPGDVIKVLRVVVGLDAPPSPAPADASEFDALTPPAPELPINAPPPVDPDSARVVLAAHPAQPRAGDLLTIQIRLEGLRTPPSGASFTLAYPDQALDWIELAPNTATHLVPLQTATLCRPQAASTTAPARVHFAAASAQPWLGEHGLLAELRFRVRPEAERGFHPIAVDPVTLATHDGYALQTLAGVQLDLTAGTRPSLQLLRADDGLELWLSPVGELPQVIEVSPDLRTWRPLATFDPGNGNVRFVDPEGFGHSARFYRVRSGP